MPTSTKGFITTALHPYEALNRVLNSFVRICSRNHLRQPHRHPFHLVRMWMGDHRDFYVMFTNDREPNAQRILQIGYYEDTIERPPVGTKISFSVGAHGDCEFIVKSALLAALEATGAGEAYYLAHDLGDGTFEGPLGVQDLMEGAAPVLNG
jgi:hypothetical protein